jgi:hypothetical protein
VSEESVERVRQSFLRSPKTSVRLASRELEISTVAVWRVLREREALSSSLVAVSSLILVHGVLQPSHKPKVPLTRAVSVERTLE